MKIALIALAISLGGSGWAVAAETSQSPMTKSNAVCLDAGHIDHTTVVDGQTILFYMRGGKIWKNTLPEPCPGLKFERAFSEEINGDVICSSMQMIRVMHTGAMCSLGPFTPYTPPASAATK